MLLLLLAGPAQAAGPLAHREVLANGAVLLVAERPAIPIVVVRVGVPAGAVHDPADALGVANLTAALLTRGTARRTGPELDRAIEFVGGSLEAGAGSDGAAVTLSVLKKDLALGLDLLAEVLLQPAFAPDELGRKVADIQGSLRRVGAGARDRRRARAEPADVPRASVRAAPVRHHRIRREDHARAGERVLPAALPAGRGEHRGGGGRDGRGDPPRAAAAPGRLDRAGGSGGRGGEGVGHRRRRRSAGSSGT